jgi:hypothetical protein
MARIYKLDHFTKGTGASVSPLDEEAVPQRKTPLEGVKLGGEPSREAKKRTPGTKTSTPLAPGHVRKKATGEIGKVKAVDSQAGTVTVLWLRQGRTSTVPIDTVTRR